MTRKTAVIIGAGPAGLTAAVELLRRTDFVPVILERGERMGGLLQTAEYKGNRIDIGGHRFFSKSDRVMTWWLDMLPMERTPPGGQTISLRDRPDLGDARPRPDRLRRGGDGADRHPGARRRSPGWSGA